jgi:ParB family chromosome partitioning protein
VIIERGINPMQRELREVAVQAIHSDPTQPRKDFDEEALWDLRTSIFKNGLLQPISVRANSDGYIIIAGERRWRAVKMLEWETIPAIIITWNQDGTKKAKALQLIENVHRKDLNPIEVAQGYQAFIDDYYTKEEIADILGTTKNIITWQLYLLNCQDQIKHLISKGQLSTHIGAELGKLSFNGQTRAMRHLHGSHLTHHEQMQLCQHIYAEEHSIEMFPEAKLTTDQVASRKKARTALDRACQAVAELQKLEDDNPGTLSGAVVEKLEITSKQVDNLISGLRKIRRSLGQRKVAMIGGHNE